ncbi:chemotaxis protein CheY [Arthrobacter sp. RIT-PI-e]|uniref:response regulator n=1 Tax=Arthrobacter sp. RIT-PI-e TaxID=1681197 RepID=UPI000675F30B|nr:response regulator [Arthrobacter sp. RIT-PI-e]KNC18973.1 chemotaxis protein CheY [Arthrobacter sp. RIT-PI-e]
MSGIRVLVVEDDPVAAEAHAEYVRRMTGFDLVGTVRSGAELAVFLRLAGTPGPATAGVDLILLDMNLPDVHGLDVVRRVRALGLPVDVIAITAVRDLRVVRSAISSGIVQYLIKPFTFSAFQEKLGAYQEFRRTLVEQTSVTTQADVDHAFASLRTAGGGTTLPKGLSAETLRGVSAFLATCSAPTSATEVSEALAISRVTARRYLEYLADQQSVQRSSRYGSRGRPEFEYGLPDGSAAH